MRKHLIYDYSEGDEIKVRYEGETHFHTIDDIDRDHVTFEDGTTFVINRKSRTNGEIQIPSEEADPSKVLAGATVVPGLYSAF